MAAISRPDAPPVPSDVLQPAQTDDKHPALQPAQTDDKHPALQPAQTDDKHPVG